MFEEIIGILNGNEGVIATIPIIGGFISKLLSHTTKDTASKIDQRITIFGSNNTIEGQTVGQKAEVARPTRVMAPHIICEVRTYTLDKFGSCFCFEIFEEKFVIPMDRLGEFLLGVKQTNDMYEIPQETVVKLMKATSHFNPNTGAIRPSPSLYSVISNELMSRNLVIEVRVDVPPIKSLPFHTLYGTDFGQSEDSLQFYMSSRS